MPCDGLLQPQPLSHNFIHLGKETRYQRFARSSDRVSVFSLWRLIAEQISNYGTFWPTTKTHALKYNFLLLRQFQNCSGSSSSSIQKQYSAAETEAWFTYLIANLSVASLELVSEWRSRTFCQCHPEEEEVERNELEVREAREVCQK